MNASSRSSIRWYYLPFALRRIYIYLFHHLAAAVLSVCLSVHTRHIHAQTHTYDTASYRRVTAVTRVGSSPPNQCKEADDVFVFYLAAVQGSAHSPSTVDDIHTAGTDCRMYTSGTTGSLSGTYHRTVMVVYHRIQRCSIHETLSAKWIAQAVRLYYCCEVLTHGIFSCLHPASLHV